MKLPEGMATDFVSTFLEIMAGAALIVAVVLLLVLGTYEALILALILAALMLLGASWAVSR